MLAASWSLGAVHHLEGIGLRVLEGNGLSVDDQLHALLRVDRDDQLAWFIILFWLVCDSGLTNRLGDWLGFWHVASTSAILTTWGILAIEDVLGARATAVAA